MTVRHRVLPVVATLVLLIGAVVGLQAAHDRVQALQLTGQSTESVLYVASPEVMKRAVLSYRPLAADIYWIRAVQYFGGTRLSRDPHKNFDLLYPLLDIATTLDPFFKGAYRLGAIFLAEPPPGGPGRSDQAIALLQKGLKQQPDSWEYAQDIGFVYYWSRHDYPAAAEWFRRGGAMPGGPTWLDAVAATTLAKGGNRADSRRLWQEMLKSDADWMRSNAAFHLSQLDALDDIDALEHQVQVYEQRTGMRPRSWEDLGRAGLLRALPRDPEGNPYRLDPATAMVTLDPMSRLNPLPVLQPPPPVR